MTLLSHHAYIIYINQDERIIADRWHLIYIKKIRLLVHKIHLFIYKKMNH